MAKEGMKDLEKQVTEDDSMDAVPPPVQVMAGGEEQGPLIILVDRRINPAEEGGGGGGVAAKMNLGLKNWRIPYGLVAGSAILMTNHIHTAAPKLIPPELAMFALFLCGTGLMFLAMKKQMVT